MRMWTSLSELVSKPTYPPEPRPARSAPVAYPSPPEAEVDPADSVPSFHVPKSEKARSKEALKYSL